MTAVRPLVNPLHLLLLLRCLLVGRLQAVQAVEAACGEWWKKRKGERGGGGGGGGVVEDEWEEAGGGGGGGGGGKSDRMDAVTLLVKRVEEEKAKVHAALQVLPSYEELDAQAELQEREDRDATARHAIIKKRLIDASRAVVGGRGEGGRRGRGG